MGYESGPAGGGRPDEVAELDGLNKRAAAAGMALNVAAVLILALMVFKPGA